jgi:uracil-DNA glycosylase, family 4
MDHRECRAQEISDTVRAVRMAAEFELLFSGELPARMAPEEDKPAKVRRLLAAVEACTLCSLHAARTKVVFGDGSLDARVMFVGEAPGRDEDLQGKPFVGAAGGLLSKIIQAMGMRRDEVYITNVLRCRPPNNRNPLPEEVVCCRPYLLELIGIIKPKVICTLGKFAAGALLERLEPISRLRGVFHDFQGIALMPTFHPAYLLRNPEDKKLVWDDIKKIMEYLRSDETGKTN